MTKITPANCLRLKTALYKPQKYHEQTDEPMQFWIMTKSLLDVSSSAFGNAYLSDAAIICLGEYELQIKFYDLLSEFATKHKIRLATVAHMFTSVRDCRWFTLANKTRFI